MVPNVLVPQLVEQSLEVPKIIPQDRILRRTVKQIVDRSEAKRADLAEAEKSLATLVAYQAVSNRSCTHMAPDHEDFASAYAEKLKVLADATQMIRSETGGAEGQTDSLFQESSGASLKTSTDLEGLKVMTMVRRLAVQEQSAALAQLASRISAIMKFGADTDDDPVVKVEGLVMSLISRLHDESLSQASQKAWCNEETSNATGKREYLKADTAKCSSSHETAVSKSSVVDGEISALQSELGILSNRQLQMDIMCAKVKADVEQDISGVQKALETLRHHSMNSTNRVQQRLVEQTIEIPVIPFVEKIVEMLVNQTREKTCRPRTRMFNTSLTQPRWKLPGSSRRQCVERNPSSGRKSTRLPSTSGIRRFRT